MINQEKMSDFVLPDLDYDYGELEPYINAQIMELHHTKHHQTYVNNLNQALEKYQHAQSHSDIESMISLQSAIRFNGGGHINHTLFWKMLSPKSKGGGQLANGELKKAIEQNFGSVEKMKDNLSKQAATIQGSGWGWLAYNKTRDRLELVSCSNQDPIAQTGLVGLFGIDVWEHAYYLQYKNVRPEYIKNIWEIANWTYVEQRYLEARKS